MRITPNRAWTAAALTLALTTAVSRPARPATPYHANIVQGLPVSGCRGRTANLKPPKVPWVAENEVDPAKIYVLRAARILEPSTGEVTRNGWLVVRGQCILGINLPVPEGAESVELGDVTLLPGLIDLHTHLLLRDEDQTWPYSILWKTTAYRIIEGVDAAAKTLAIGFTTVRDTDHEGAVNGDTALRDAIARGVIPGPQVLAAGPGITITGGDMNLELINPELQSAVPQPAEMADGPGELVFRVRDQIRKGSDWVKIYANSTRRQTDPIEMEPLPQFTADEIRLVVNEARRYRRDVAAHVYGGAGAQAAILGGVRTIEHGPLLSDADIALAVRHGTYWVPTLVTYYKRQSTDFERRFVLRHEEVFRKALKAGVRIGFGTDVGSFPHGTSNEEFDLMVRYGMTPLQAVRSATSVAADVLRMTGQIGTLSAGADADVIAVAGDPLSRMSDIRNVRFVMADGRIFRNEVTPQHYAWQGVR